MKQELLTANGLHGVLWLPEYKLRAVVQVTHGMTEHMGRYEKLAEILTSCGIAVGGFDLRGHGRSGTDPDIASFGEGGWAATLEDMHAFRSLLRDRLGQLPYFMLGFSLGSFLLREYLTEYGTEGIAGAVIMGTGHQSDKVLTPLMAMVKKEIKKCGFDGTTKMVDRLSFGTYNKKLGRPRTRADWLCTDDHQIDAYLADPLVREHISAGLFWELLGSMQRTGAANAYDNWRKDLPILLVSGIDDPVGDYGEGVDRVFAAMQQAGLTGVYKHLFPITRHDILHEEHSSTGKFLRTMIASFVCRNM